jgi:hypothetical protein
MFIDSKPLPMTRVCNAEATDEPSDGPSDPHKRRVIHGDVGAQVTADELASTHRAFYRPSLDPRPEEPSPWQPGQAGAGLHASALVESDADHEMEVQPVQVQRITLAPAPAPMTDIETDMSDDDRARRIEWIKYYVRIGEPFKARALGWDGKPFRGMVPPPDST